MALGLVVALLAVTMPATAIAPISESSYAETRLWTFEHQDPAGSRAERGLSRTGIEGYQLSSWKPRRAVPFTRGGQQVALHNYFPFGQEATSAEADEIQLKFTGHERDKTGTGSRSELDYMHARHCSPVVGRFLSVDPSLGSRSSPQSWNRFSYVSNSPINQVDPDGRLGFLVTAFLGGVVDVGIQIASNALSGEELTSGVAGAFVTGAVAGATGLGLLKVAGRGAKLVGAVRNAKKLKKSAAAADAARAGAKGQTGSRIGVTRHGVNQKINRGVRSVDELDAIKNPLDTRPVKIDELGRSSQRLVGRNAEVVRNPRTGEIISVNPTSTKKAQRLLRRLEDQ